MARAKQYDTEIHYFSDRLTARLKKIISAKTTLIEAPSGYGKTTAVQDFLKENLPPDSEYLWFVCIDESPSGAWRRFCNVIRRIDPYTGDELLKIGFPDMDTVGDVSYLLREVDCRDELWLVIDDFQLMKNIVPFVIWKSLIGHTSEFLHVVILTQVMDEPGILIGGKSGVIYLDSDDLRLEVNETAEYYSKVGISLTTDRLYELYRKTEGWMVAVYLQMLHYLDTGEFTRVIEIRTLLREIVWNSLSDKEREFLLCLSPFDVYSMTQAAYMINEAQIPDYGKNLSEGNAFIRAEPSGHMFHMHSTLLDFVREEFELLSVHRKEEIIRRAGDWCAVNHKTEDAIQFYYSVRDYKKIMSLDMVGLELENVNGMYTDMFIDIVTHCTDDMKIRYPLSFIGIAFFLFGLGCYEVFVRMCSEIAPLIEHMEIPAEEKNQIYGLLALFKSFMEFNDIKKMSECHRQAYELMNGKPFIMTMTESWTFGSPSVMFTYHSEAGKLDDELSAMDECMPYYYAISKGHGSGAEALMRAEVLFNRGFIDEAEIAAHKAWYQSEIKRQPSVYLGAAMLLERIAVMKGKSEDFSATAERISRCYDNYPSKSNHMEVDMIKGFFAELLDKPETVPGWIKSGDFGNNRLFGVVIPYAQMLYGKYLILSGRPEVWLGMADDVTALAENLRYPLAVIYNKIYSASAWVMRHDYIEAVRCLKEAFEAALCDGIIIPFSENYRFIEPVIEECCPREVFEKIKIFHEKIETNKNIILTEYYGEHIPYDLTAREYETAKLAAGGYSNPEIAEKLFVSRNTVKTHLKSAYQKIGTSSRPELKKIFEKTDT